MRLVRRLSAALSSILLLQLSLLGSGTLCALQHSAGHGAPETVSSGMRAMMHGPVGTAASSMLVEQPADGNDNPANGCGGNAPADSCGVPWSTGTCASMISCASSQDSERRAVA